MRKLLFAFILVIPLFFTSCEPDGPYAGRHVKNVKQGGLSTEFGPACCVTLDCPKGQSGCQEAYEDYGTLCDGQVCVNTTQEQLNTFYDYYYNDQIPEFLVEYDVEEYFPEISPEHEEYLVTGIWGFKVLYDSSIVIVDNPSSDSLGVNNIIAALKRHREPE